MEFTTEQVMQLFSQFIAALHQSTPAPAPLPSTATPQAQAELAKMSEDNFSRALRGQQPLTATEAQAKKLEWQIGPDLADALVSKPERQDYLRATYGPGWVEGGYDPNALLAMIVIRERQVAMWDYARNLPTEPLSKSILFARYNQWATNGNSIKDALTHDPD